MNQLMILKRVLVGRGYKALLQCHACHKTFWLLGGRITQGVGKYCSHLCANRITAQLPHVGFQKGHGKSDKAYSFPIGRTNPQWKGLNAQYLAFHTRVQRRRGIPKHCTECRLNDPSRKYEWANLTGHYHDPQDYKRLCTPCHRRFDNQRRLSRHK